MNHREALEALRRLDREYRHLCHVLALLQWDQETCLPKDGVMDRSEQLALLGGMAHEQLIDPKVGKHLAEAGVTEKNPQGDERFSGEERDFLRVFSKEYYKAIKLPPDFVRYAAKAEGLSQAAWVEARQKSDFSFFMPHLSTMVEIAKKRTQYWGYGDRAYDGLLDIYEPGMTEQGIQEIFAPLAVKLKDLAERITAKGIEPSIFSASRYDSGIQHQFSLKLMDYLGFDTKRGRLDTSAHPFTTTLGTRDVRITTRYIEENPLSGIFSTIHEMGHAFYELGLPDNLRGSCLGDGSSMGIHESQSRLWENVIGRSRAFWTGLFPLLGSYFPGQLGSISLDAFIREVNRVALSPIRIEADELSYSLHIILRFELERRLFSGKLSVEELPRAWNALMKEYFNIEVENDREGVLQDVHWSMGSFGYFPSYALGNLYGLQLWKKLCADIPQADSCIAQGKFEKIRAWLNETVYVWGRRLCPEALLIKATGQKLKADSFMEYIETKYTAIYGL
ncbi:MAG: carboxypeptidase M32 [Spirochaetaceae bacterium]|jgi:carboxypeptidase Taq|nr:carboxypeptidase M32 [Spirochaetaceae bacterium]